MMKYSEYVVGRRGPAAELYPNHQVVYKFPNGWGASVIRGPYTYGGSDGLWELAVLDPEGDINYEHPVAAGDVRGHLTGKEVEELLRQIKDETVTELVEPITEL